MFQVLGMRVHKKGDLFVLNSVNSVYFITGLMSTLGRSLTCFNFRLCVFIYLFLLRYSSHNVVYI